MFHAVLLCFVEFIKQCFYVVDANRDVAGIVKAFMVCNALEYAREIVHQLRKGDVQMWLLRLTGVFSVSIGATFH